MAWKREPVPAGPIADLFDSLHDLHLHAGEPGVREIASAVGIISSTTVHNIFRGPGVPRWGYLELIVEQLGGDAERFRGLWTAARLAERTLANPAAPEAPNRYDFLVVGYHLPTREARNDPCTVAGGLSMLAAKHDGVWVGWSPSPVDPAESARNERPALRRVDLSAVDHSASYEGYFNSTIWPLYHDAIEQPEFRAAWREANHLVSQRFADMVAASAAHGALVWVHDYHLQLLPGMLRRRRPDLRIGFFCHIPLPPTEMFLRLPDRLELLRGILGADLVGFQHPQSVRNFTAIAEQLLGLRFSEGSAKVEGRTVVVGAFPISVDIAAFESVARRDGVRGRAAEIRSDLGGPEKILLGLDRLDYTKGIAERLEAYGKLLDQGRISPGTTAFIQVTTLSRERLANYAQLRGRVERLAGRLNASHGRVGNVVVSHIERPPDLAEKVALYLAADVIVVSPLKDGMNLVAKEYVASRIDDRGVLVLSEFAGAAAELRQAVMVNPYDLEGFQAAVLKALTMGPREQVERMSAMRGLLRTYDFEAWHSAFLTALNSIERR